MLNFMCKTLSAFGVALCAVCVLQLCACSGTLGKLREGSERAASDRVNAWKGKKTKKQQREQQDNPLAQAREEPRKRKRKAVQSDLPAQTQMQDREYLDEALPGELENTSEPAVDVVTTQDFSEFLRLVRDAIRNRDAESLAPLMTPNFGYNLEPLMEGPGVFEYWEQNNVWPSLELIVGQQFVPNGGFMVAPPQFTSDPGYVGYRAGMVKTQDGWRFAYFVSGN